MHKILRFYNKNRIKVWTIIIAIILGISLIQTLNKKTIEEGKKEENQGETTLNNVVSYDKQSESIISQDNVPKEYSDKIGEVIGTFFSYCCNHEPEKAYDMLTDDMKNLKYPNKEIFLKNYYANKFEGNKEYSFKSWIVKKNSYTYLVNIYENMLSTGKSNNDEYIEDYITVVPSEDTYKINIDGYIGREFINKETEDENINMKLAYRDIYMDYELDTFYIKNNTDTTIMIDTMENTKNTYLLDSNKNKYDAFVYENKTEDMIFKANEVKNVTIKFNVAYREDLKIKKVYFSKIVNYDEYKNNKDVESKVINIEL